jgi:GT2 family glycosyltransferase
LELLNTYLDRLPITVLRHTAPGKSSAVNAALDYAQGELVVFTDDDIRADPNWLRAIMDCARDQPEYGIFGGRIVPEWECYPRDVPFLDWIPMGSTFAVIDETISGPCRPDKIWGPNMVIRKSVLGNQRFREDIGPLPSGLFAMGEDSEIVLRFAKQGIKTYRCAEAIVHHLIPASHVNERWVQRRAERLGFGTPARFPEEVPIRYRIAGVPILIWLQFAFFTLKAAMLYPFPQNKWRFWAIWSVYYCRGLIAGVRKYIP